MPFGGTEVWFMAKKLRYALLTILIALIAAFTLFGCASVNIVSIELTDSPFKTTYVVGESFDYDGMEVLVKKTDGSTETFAVAERIDEIKLINFSTARAGDLTVILQYRRKEVSFAVKVITPEQNVVRHTVTFDAQGGSDVPSAFAEHLGNVARPDDPQKDGYAFDGWYREKQCLNAWNFETGKVTSDLTLYAKWTILRKVTFYVDGTEYAVRWVKDGSNVTDVPVVPLKEGMDGTWDHNLVGIRADISVKAQYSVRMFSVAFYGTTTDSEGNPQDSLLLEYTGIPFGTVLSETDPYKQAIAEITANIKSPDNKHFVGWNFDLSEPLRANTTVYAQYAWDRKTATFDANGGTFGFESVTVDYNSPIFDVNNLPADPVRKGYAFEGWFDASGAKWDFASQKLTQDIALTAKWIKVYSIAFFYEDGTEFGVYQAKEGSNFNANVPATPYTEQKPEEGYLGAWQLKGDPLADLKIVLSDIRGNLEIVATYQKREFTVRFYNAGEIVPVNGMPEQKVKYLEAATLPETDPEREGHRFVGWGDVDLDCITANTDVYAEFKVNIYEVTFRYGVEGMEDEVRSVEYDTPILAIPSPTRPGYDFDGWVNESGNFWQPADVVKADTVLVARWTQRFTLTFLDESGELVATREVRFGEKLTDIPLVPDKVGYDGDWWYQNNDFDFSKEEIRRDYEFNATYVKQQFIVQFVSEGVVFAEIKNVEWGTQGIAAPAEDPIKEGHLFVGWTPDPATTVIEGNTTFDAVFEAEEYTVTFKDWDGTVLYTKGGLKYGANRPQVASPSRTGYVFIGWDYEGQIYSDMTIVAQYRIETYTLTFRDDADFQKEYRGREYGSEFAYPEADALPQKQGYTLKGWKLGEVTIGIYDTITVESNMVIYAVFEINRYTVTFDGNGAAYETVEVAVDYGTTVQPPADNPVITGMAFLGWYYGIGEDVRRFDFSTPIVEDVALWANWTPQEVGSQGIVYTLNAEKTGWTVSGVDQNFDRSAPTLSIDNYRDQLPVVAINSGVFRGIEARIVSLPNTLQSVGPNAFADCVNLTTVNLPSTLRTIGTSAFHNCVSLANVTSGPVLALTEIGTSAFANTPALQGITLAAPLTTIGANAFAGSGLVNIVIPESVVRIETGAFRSTAGLKRVYFENEIAISLPKGVFDLTNTTFKIYVNNINNYTINIPETSGWYELQGRILSESGISTNGYWSFAIIDGPTPSVRLLQYLNSATYVEIPETLQVPGYDNPLPVKEATGSLFNASLVRLTIHSTLSVDEFVLASAVGLKQLELIIPASGEFILNRAYLLDLFRSVDSLETLIVSARMPLQDILGALPPSNLKHVEIRSDNDITELPARMFENCASIVSVSVPRSIAVIGDKAFYNCSQLETVSFRDGLVQVGTEAFYGCNSLSTINLPSTVTEIGKDAFYANPWLDDVTDAEGFVIVGKDIVYEYRGSAEVVTVPSNVYMINQYAFAGNATIRALIVDPDGALQYVGDYAFDGCFRLEYVMLSDRLERVGAYAFNGCTKLATVVMTTGSRAPKVGENAFSGNLSERKFYALNISESFYRSDTEYWKAMVDAESVRFFEFSYLLDEKMLIGVNSDATATLLKYWGIEEEYVLPMSVTDGETERAVSAVGPFALMRGMTALTADVTLNFDERAFGGLTSLTRLTLTGTEYGSTGVKQASAVVLGNLLGDNASLTEIVVGGRYPLSELFDRMPQNVTKVTMFAGETGIADGMFAGCAYVTEIGFPTAENIEIGVGLFDGCAWRDLQDDYILLGDMLIDYRGSDRVLKIPASVGRINKNLFRGNDTIEVVIFGDSVREIGSGAFAAMPSLTKIIVESDVPASIAVDTFGGFANGFKMVVRTDDPAAYQSAAVWAGLNLSVIASTSGIVGDYYVAPIGENELMLVQYIGNDVMVAVPETLMFDGKERTVTELDSNLFLSFVTEIEISGADTVDPYVFENLSVLTRVILKDASSDMALDWNQLSTLFAAGSDRNPDLHILRYNAAVPLSELLQNNLSSKLTRIEAEEGVTEIVDNWLAGASYVSEIEIPSSVVTFGINAFEDTAWYQRQSGNIIFNGYLYRYKGTPQATHSIPKSVEVVGKQALSDQRSIAKIVFEPGSAAYAIEANAFKDCTGLTSIDLPASMIRIDSTAFDGTKIVAVDNMLIASGVYETLVAYYGSDTVVRIPDTVKVINQGAFAGKPVKTLSFTANSLIQFIRDEAFKGSKLTTVQIEGTGEGDPALSGFPASLLRVGKDAFADTPWLAAQAAQGESVVINDKILYLYKGKGADVEVVIPDTVTSVTEGALSGVGIVRFEGNINLDRNEMYGILSDPALHTLRFNGVGSLAALIGSSEVFDNLKTVEIIDGSTAISDEMLKGWSSVTEVVIPASVTEIGKDAFAGTAWYESKLASLPEGKKHIVFNGILYYFEVEDDIVTIPAEVRRIPYAWAFSENLTASSVRFAAGSAIESIAEDAFSNLKGVTEIVLPQTFIDAYVGDFIVYNNILAAYKGMSADVVIPASVQYFGGPVFAGNTRIASVSFESGSKIAAIPAGTFDGCASLATIDLPQSVVTIGQNAFRGTAWMNNAPHGLIALGGILIGYTGTETSVVIPNTVRTISSYVFAGNTTIAKISFAAGSRLSLIEEGAFAGCTALWNLDLTNATTYVDAYPSDYIVLDGILAKYKGISAAIVVPKSVTRISTALGTFNSSAIESLRFEEGAAVERIKNGTFNGSALMTVDLSGVKIVESNAFAGCMNLTILTIGKDTESLEARSFQNCTALQEIRIPPDSIVTIEPDAFLGAGTQPVLP